MCNAQTTPLPPGFWNRVDWRALVKDLSPQVAKIREKYFWQKINIKKISDFLKKRDFSRFFQIFPDFFLRIGLDWRALFKVCIPNIEKQRGFFVWFLCYKIHKKKNYNILINFLNNYFLIVFLFLRFFFTVVLDFILDFFLELWNFCIFLGLLQIFWILSKITLK